MHENMSGVQEPLVSTARTVGWAREPEVSGEGEPAAGEKGGYGAEEEDGSSSFPWQRASWVQGQQRHRMTRTWEATERPIPTSVRKVFEVFKVNCLPL